MHAVGSGPGSFLRFNQGTMGDPLVAKVLWKEPYWESAHTMKVDQAAKEEEKRIARQRKFN